MPSLRQLEYLVALSETRHFRRAAERTSTTQPTLSEQIKALEDRLGTKLVERSRAGAILTPTGNRIVQIARRMLGDTQEIRSIAAMEDDKPRGILRLGLTGTISQPFLPTILLALRDAFPDLQIYPREGLSQKLPIELEDGGYDYLILPSPVRGDELAVFELMREPIYLAMSATHPVAIGRKFEPTMLRGQEFLTLGMGQDQHDLTDELCERWGARIRLEYTCSSLNILRDMTAMGLGLCLLPAVYARRCAQSNPDLKLLPAPAPASTRTLNMVWRKSSPRSAMFEALAELIRSAITREPQTSTSAA